MEADSLSRQTTTPTSAALDLEMQLSQRGERTSSARNAIRREMIRGRGQSRKSQNLTTTRLRPLVRPKSRSRACASLPYLPSPPPAPKPLAPRRPLAREKSPSDTEFESRRAAVLDRQNLVRLLSRSGRTIIDAGKNFYKFVSGEIRRLVRRLRFRAGTPNSRVVVFVQGPERAAVAAVMQYKNYWI